MHVILGAEAGAFLNEVHRQPTSGLRLNPLKTSPAGLLPSLPFDLEPIPWSPLGFHIRSSTTPPGLHPYHAAGLYYIQEPSAQAVAEILSPQPGERVLDLAAAPGGKTTHIAGLMQGRGFLLASEIHRRRVWDLVRNLERWGARNVAVASETPERLADLLPGYFDRVLVDAPCSGEGMFRRVPQTIDDWSPAFITACAARQTGILDHAARLVRPGGRLCYATCTFAPEENEAIIARFLETHTSYHLLAPEVAPGFSLALPPFNDPGSPSPVRIWPHRAPGEGHFIALLERDPGAETAALPGRAAQPALTRLLPLWESFARDNLAGDLHIPASRLLLAGSRLYLAPEQAPELRGLNLPRPGLQLGSFKKDRFEPAHALAMALRPGEVLRHMDLPLEGAGAYLRREALPSEGADGWTHVLLQGRYPLGWGKRVRGRLKNHYPKELRVL